MTVGHALNTPGTALHTAAQDTARSFADRKARAEKIAQREGISLAEAFQRIWNVAA